MELQASRSWGEGSEGDGEVHEPVRPVADGHNPGLGIGDPAGLVLFLADTIDDMLLWVAGARLGDRTDEVDLIVLLHINDMIGVVDSEHWAGVVPVNKVHLLCSGSRDGESRQRQEQLLWCHFFCELSLWWCPHVSPP